ncbi:960_t:CDS:2 [Dentiscutata heterogama]|uniref:960_t:CDS:1 n=1 Tax=Dentiscutata heterogama TaxID=1316150 RepID=A0ACA9MJ01_9GLOM|nr:960_t:CDS:2 [Dentiscutata heterogama]
MSTLNIPQSNLEFKLCKKTYKRPSSLAKHEQLIQDANIMRSTVYDLPEEAIEETRKMLVYHIKERLKQHSRYARNVHIIINCTESQFFGVFKEYIHNYYSKTGGYKCIFKGVDSYFILSQILRDDNWDIKYFLQHQKTSVLLYQLPSSLNEFDPLQKSNSLQESNLLQESNPLQGSDSFQEFDPLQETDPLQEFDPLQESNPLQESDPFQKSSSFQKFNSFQESDLQEPNLLQNISSFSQINLIQDSNYLQVKFFM